MKSLKLVVIILVINKPWKRIISSPHFLFFLAKFKEEKSRHQIGFSPNTVFGRGVKDDGSTAAAVYSVTTNKIQGM